MHFTVALEKVDFLPPVRVTDDTSILTLKNLVFEPLLRWRTGGLVEPGLFAHWSHSDEGRRWLFHLRPGARFHDGPPCTADDVVSFIDAIRESVDTFGMKWSYARYLAATEITAVGVDCVEVVNPEPIAAILDIFAEFYISRADPSGTAVLGTGPYRVAAFTPGARAVLARVGAGLGPERITFVAEPDADARYARLRRGDVEVALNLERMHQPNPDDNLRWGRAGNTLSVMYYLNCAEGLFAHPTARLAANHAVDRERLLADLFGGLGIPAATVVSPFHLGMGGGQIRPLSYDLDRAKALLDASGGPTGIKLRTPLFMPERAPAISAFVSESLADLGLSVSVETEPNRPEYARQVGRKEIGDLAIFDSSPQSTFRVLDDKISSTTRAVWWQGYEDCEAEAEFASARRAVEPEAREARFSRCLSRLNANPPWLYLFHPIDIFAYRPDLAPLSIDHRGMLRIL